MGDEVLVLGAGFEGVNAALDLAREGFEVTIIDMRGYHEYIPGIINLFSGRIDIDRLRVRLEDLFEDTGVEFREEAVMQIDPENQIVGTSTERLEYDHLVVALGGEPRTFGMDIADVEPVYNVEEAQHIAENIEDIDSVIIVGSGYVGIETAFELNTWDVEVTVVDQATRPMPRCNQTGSELALEQMNEEEIKFRGGHRAEEVSHDHVELENGVVLEADRVLWAGGVQASEVVQESFDTDGKGIDVNPGLASKEYENVFAAGDCADSGFNHTAHNAWKEGELIARNLSKEQHEELEKYEEGKEPMAISLGKTGMLVYGDRVYMNRLFRRFKDLIRYYYWFNLKKKKFALKYF